MPDHYIKGTSGTIRKTSGLSVTDGSTTVDPTTRLNFTSGATVSDLGSGEAGVAVSGGGGGGGGGESSDTVLDATSDFDASDDFTSDTTGMLVNFNVVNRDDLGIWDDSTGTGTMPVGAGGDWEVSFSVDLDTNSADTTTPVYKASFMLDGVEIFSAFNTQIIGSTNFSMLIPATPKLVTIPDGSEFHVQLRLQSGSSAAGGYYVNYRKATHLFMRKVSTAGGAFSGALVGLKERFTSSGAPHEAAFDTGASLVDYPVYPLSGVTISGNTLVVGTDGIWRIEFSVQVNYDNGIVGPTIPEGTMLWVQCSFTGWIASNATYGFGPMSSAKVTDAEPTNFQNMFSASIAVPMHAGDTVKVRVQSYNGTRTDVAGLFGIQRLGDIPT